MPRWISNYSHCTNRCLHFKIIIIRSTNVSFRFLFLWSTRTSYAYNTDYKRAQLHYTTEINIWRTIFNCWLIWHILCNFRYVLRFFFVLSRSVLSSTIYKWTVHKHLKISCTRDMQYNQYTKRWHSRSVHYRSYWCKNVKFHPLLQKAT